MRPFLVLGTTSLLGLLAPVAAMAQQVWSPGVPENSTQRTPGTHFWDLRTASVLNLESAGATDPSDNAPQQLVEAGEPLPAPGQETPDVEVIGSGNGATYQHYGNHGGVWGSPCGTDGACAHPLLPGIPWVLDGCRWFGGAYGLVMTRDDDFDTTLSYETADPLVPVMSTSSADFNYAGGVEARIGRRLGSSGCYAIEAAYWGIFPDPEFAWILNGDNPGDLSSALGFDGLEYDPGTGAQPLSDFFGAPGAPAFFHALDRRWEAHNVELNLIRNPTRKTGCTHYELLAGVRYLNVDEHFNFSSDTVNSTFGDNPETELVYCIDTENHLIGFQVGGRVDHYVTCRLSGHLGAKLGIYNNHIRHRQQAAGGNGLATVAATGEDFFVRNSEDNTAFIGELIAGASYDVGCRWRITGGYRAVILSEVVLATSQIPRDRDFSNLARVADLDSSDSLILHGAYLGAEYNW